MNIQIPTTCFDIETKPDDIDKILSSIKPFNPADVKLGNTKDPEKVAEKIDKAESKYINDSIDKAALDPLTGSICGIGIHLHEDPTVTILAGDEVDILNQFWGYFSNHNDHNWAYYTGSNDKSCFDVRWILMRSWINRIKVPFGIVSRTGFVNGAFVDLAQMYLAGSSKYPAYCGLDRACAELGLEGTDVGFATVLSKESLKASTGITGANYHKMLQDDPDAAEAYLVNDVAITKAIADILL